MAFNMSYWVEVRLTRCSIGRRIRKHIRPKRNLIHINGDNTAAAGNQTCVVSVQERRKPLEWTVFFLNKPERGHWWTYLIKKGYRHVFAMAYDTNHGCWLCVDPASDALFIQVLTDNEAQKIWAHGFALGQLILAVPPSGVRITVRPLSVYNCVAVIRRLLCVAGFIVTPWQLAKKLLAGEHTVVYRRE